MFSIITVCLNDLPGLIRTAKSLDDQTSREFEWIVVDGGSTDGTSQWLQHRDGVEWCSEPDEGLYDAMNKGMQRAQGDYLMFLNSGDALADALVLSDVLEEIRSSDDDIDLIYGDSVDVTESGREFYRRARSHRLIWLGMFTQHQAMVFRRGRIGDQSHDTALTLSADYAFVAHFLSSASEEPVVRRLTRPLCRYLLGGLATRNRRIGMREDRYVRRRILRLNPAIVWFVHGSHWVHHQLRTHAPHLFRVLRYQDRR